MASNDLSSPSIPLVRAEYLFPYIGLFRQLGMPVDRELQRAGLPTLIEELPQTYVSMDFSFRFVENCLRAEGMDDLGFEAGWRLRFSDLGTDLKNALRAMPTLKMGIETFCRLVSMEDSELCCRLTFDDKTSRVYVRQYVPPGAQSRIAEWQNPKAIIEVIRSHAGPDWMPPAIGFESAPPLARSVRHRLGDIRILTGQRASFVQFPSHMLGWRKTGGHGGFPASRDKSFCYRQSPHTFPRDDDLSARLSAALLPYLSSGYPSILLASRIAGLSVRNLQRRLDCMQMSYSSLIDALRLEQAMYLLQQTDMKILDIALMLGYRDASNFSRALRRLSGSSPRELRQLGKLSVA
jgi:AraC-like DNA-binding protein